MDAFEWGLMGAMYAVVLAAFFTVFALEVRKNKQLKEIMPQYLLCTKRKPAAMIILIIIAAILLVGGPVTTICCSYLVEPMTREDYGVYAAMMGLIAFGGLFCLYAVLLLHDHAVYATEEGLWVRRCFLKTKFYSYDEVESIWDGTYSWNGGYAVYRKGRKKICFVYQREKNAKELMSAIKERAPHLGKLKEGELFRM